MIYPTRPKKTIENCKKCTRPYKIGNNYPKEVCPICEQEVEIKEEESDQE